MIKYFIRKTTYKKFDKETQDRLWQLNSKKHIIDIFCLFWPVVYVFPLIQLCIIYVCEEEFELTTRIASIVLTLTWFMGFLVLMEVFTKATFGFSELLAERTYFLVCTTKGKVLGKADFKDIKKVNEKLYMLVSTQKCKGYCYAICFEMCKALKKGNIEFLAMKKFSPHDDEEDDGKDFTMHVLYVNNGWAFDTYSSRQYPIERLHEICRAKIYKTFSFDEISSKSFEEFMEEQKSELVKWSIDNDCYIDCSIFYTDGKENT